MPEDKLFYSTEEARDYLGFKHIQSIRQHVQDKSLNGTKVSGRVWIFTKQELDDFNQRRRKAGRPKKASES